MLPLDEMLMKAQNGAVIDMVSRQFDMTRDQTVSALEALVPAFSQAFKRTAATPQGVAPFLQALAGGNHTKYMDDMSRAFSPDGVADGNGILGHLFGSKEVSRAIADHAARATGIGQDILKQMLPSLAAMLMGGLYQQSTGGMKAAFGGGFGAGGNVIGEVIEQMMRQGGMMQDGERSPQRGAGTDRRHDAPEPNPFDNPFGKILQDMFGGSMANASRDPREADTRRPAPSAGDNPLGRIFEDMLSGRMGTHPAGPRVANRRSQNQENKPERDTADSRRSNPYEDLFGQMFETSREAQADYQRGMESIFDQFLKGMDRHR